MEPKSKAAVALTVIVVASAPKPLPTPKSEAPALATIVNVSMSPSPSVSPPTFTTPPTPSKFNVIESVFPETAVSLTTKVCTAVLLFIEMEVGIS